MKTASRVWLIGFYLLLSVCFQGVRKGCATFAARKQTPTHFMRQRAGLSLHKPARDKVDVILIRTKDDWVHIPGLVVAPTQQEKKLAEQVRALGDQRNGLWQKVLAHYTESPVVCTAAMHAAFKKKEYEEGLKIYRRLRQMTLPTVTIAMKLLSKCDCFDEVQRLWEQLIELDVVDQLAAEARIGAAAEGGDIQGAEDVLNYMAEKGLEANVVHFTSAIRACANAQDRGRAKKAQIIFDRMVAKGIQPNIVTYTNLLRAFKDEPSQCQLRILADMKNRNVRHNIVFAESFLFMFLKKPPKKGCWSRQEAVVSDLRKLDLADLQTAKRFIDELRDANVRLNKSAKLIDFAIKTILRKHVAHSRF